MKREWKPGDVAMLSGLDGEEVMALRQERQWATLNHLYLNDWQVTARPLVVIDPEDREQVEHFTRLYYGRMDALPTPHDDRMQAALREFGNPTPLKPDEPMGLGAVVDDEEGRRWVRDVAGDESEGAWYRRGVKKCKHWHEIAVVRVLSEGVVEP